MILRHASVVESESQQKRTFQNKRKQKTEEGIEKRVKWEKTTYRSKVEMDALHSPESRVQSPESPESRVRNPESSEGRDIEIRIRRPFTFNGYIRSQIPAANTVLNTV